MHNNNVLVIDANQRSALAVVRSLGAQTSATIFCADESTHALAGNSRFCKQYVTYPSPKSQPAEFCDWLELFVREQKIGILFPTAEISSQLILMNRDRFSGCDLPFTAYENLLSIADKWSLVALAEKLNIQAPATRFVQNASSLDIHSIKEYPVVLKPAQSHIWLGDRWLSTQVHIASSTSELAELLRQPYFRDHRFLLQEFIPGHGAGIFALYNRGKPKAFFAHRRLREKPPSGGVSVLSESANCDPLLLEQSKKLLDSVGWHGVAMVEFRISPDGTAYLMEVNTRFWGSLQLAIDSGVDFPFLLHQITNGEKIEAVGNYKTGQRLRWILGDLDRLYLMLRSGSGYTWRDKLLAVLAFFNPLGFFRTRHEVNRLSDIKPAIYEIKQYIADILRKSH